ncbi:arginyl-tRNA synthetase [Antiquaquibacter soli]|uniref:Arginyl-tRNA synthetase n=1 Tax=Antiquaquibacter soli TaxID=3064523 RepID=A0ABT9BM10_9MICO|nr:arginyl-tRNA synthetase [Protaetiibacter sp. WY-16]MDO7881498.1 arginyl-tRNA synthetase [Protaetiibacter sp. WY-16]
MRLSRHSVLLPVTALAAAVLLAACVPSDEATPTSAPTPSQSTTPTPTGSATPAPQPTAEIIPFSAACDQLVSPQALYDINPNLALLGAFDPDAGTPAADVVAAGGTACRWVNSTSGSTIDVAVAELPAEVSTALKNSLVGDSNSVPTYGVEGYFSVVGGVGEADAFPDPYWVSVVSSDFVEPGDAGPFAITVIDALG